MHPFQIDAEKREVQGKGASRRLRRAGKVPAILYGAGAEPVPLQLHGNDLLRRLDNEAFFSRILTLTIDGQKERVVLKDLQRHPFKRRVLHVDLQRVDEKEKLTMRVPVHFVNEEKCHGVKQQGGVVSHLMTEIEVMCLPRDLPEYIEIDLAELKVGDTVHLGDIQPPQGVELAVLAHGGDPGQTVVSVHLPKVVSEEGEEAPAEEGEEAALEAGAAPEVEPESTAKED